jgi:hypothetical protein
LQDPFEGLLVPKVPSYIDLKDQYITLKFVIIEILVDANEVKINNQYFYLHLILKHPMMVKVINSIGLALFILV